MDDKQIIIDARQCEWRTGVEHCGDYECMLNKCCDYNCDWYKRRKLEQQLKTKEQECEELRNKLNSSIERMNTQNEKLHNEIQTIKQQMKTILMVSNNGKYRPVKNSKKEQCYQVLGIIQELLGTNIIRLSEVNNGTNP